MKKIWVLGDAVVDLLPDEKADCCSVPAAHRQTLRSVLPGWAAERLYRQGWRRSLRRFMAKTLADEKVDVKSMRLDPAHRTSTVVVDLDDLGERSFTFWCTPERRSVFSNPPIADVQRREWLHVCSIALSAEPSRLRRLRRWPPFARWAVTSASTPIFARISLAG